MIALIFVDVSPDSAMFLSISSLSLSLIIVYSGASWVSLVGSGKFWRGAERL
jgi:hypothetical protein